MKNVSDMLVMMLIAVLFLMGCEKDAVDSNNNSGDGSCFPTLTDSRDGEIYQIVSIGNQCWMAENLRYNAPGSLLNTNNPSFSYGRHYNWAILMNGATSSSSNPSGVQGICPSGWHVPSANEWTILVSAIVGNAVGNAMSSTTGWSNNANGSNSSGFNAFPAGTYYSNFNENNQLGDKAHFWSSTEETNIVAYSRYLDNGATINQINSHKDFHHSCRCVKN